MIQVSLPNVGDSTISSMNKMFSIMKPNLRGFNLWQVWCSFSLFNWLNKSQNFISQIQLHISFNKCIFFLYNKLKLDGRPMSGDIGRGTTKESIAFAVQLAKAKEIPPGLYS